MTIPEPVEAEREQDPEQPVPRPSARRRAEWSAWLRRNRAGLVAVPIALAVTLAAASDRLVDYWWGDDLRVEDGRAAEGEVALLTGVPTYEEPSEDEPLVGETVPTTLGVSLVGVEPLTVLDDGYDTQPIPDGADAYRVDLAFRSESPVETSCRLMLVGDDGARYGDGNDPFHQYSPCARVDETAGTVSGPEGEWSNSFTILTAEGADLDVARLTYDGVHYVTLELPASR